MQKSQKRSNGVKILAIESSCDDSGVAILETEPDKNSHERNSREFTPFACPKILANLISSQIKIHAKWGGVVPMLAKREHQRNLVPLLKEALEKASLLHSLRRLDPAVAGEGSKKDSSLRSRSARNDKRKIETLSKILEREPELLKKLIPFLKKYQKPDIDYIAVTHGPGLEPALWVGINLAKVLSFVWNLPILPINHIEGHIAANFIPSNKISEIFNFQFSIFNKNKKLKTKNQELFFPAMCLVVSGGHTQLILIKNIEKHMPSLSGNHTIPVSPTGETLASLESWRSKPPFAQTHVSPDKSLNFNYRIIGETRDDAAGEAFDKVAKMLGLGYPGGPAISRLASLATRSDSETRQESRRAEKWNDQFPPRLRSGQAIDTKSRIDHSITQSLNHFSFPRPMMNSGDFDFSFSGLKTAVLYTLQKMTRAQIKKATPTIAAAFQQAVVDVLIKKTINSAKKYNTKGIWLAGGVAANQALRQSLEQAAQKNNFSFTVPSNAYCADNAAMIALAAFYQLKQNRAKKVSWQNLKAEPNLRIS